MTRSPHGPRMTAEVVDGASIAVDMIPRIACTQYGGGRAILATDEARALRDALSAALEIDDLRRAVADAQAALAARIAA